MALVTENVTEANQATASSGSGGDASADAAGIPLGVKVTNPRWKVVRRGYKVSAAALTLSIPSSL